MRQNYYMSKRSAKRRIQYEIGDAIEELVVHGGTTDKNFDQKAEQILHDQAISRINQAKKVEGRSAKKAHFKQLFAEFKDGVNKVLNSK